MAKGSQEEEDFLELEGLCASVGHRYWGVNDGIKTCYCGSVEFLREENDEA